MRALAGWSVVAAGGAALGVEVARTAAPKIEELHLRHSLGAPAETVATRGGARVERPSKDLGSALTAGLDLGGALAAGVGGTLFLRATSPLLRAGGMLLFGAGTGALAGGYLGYLNWQGSTVLQD